jgi:hypothetical protein
MKNIISGIILFTSFSFAFAQDIKYKKDKMKNLIQTLLFTLLVFATSNVFGQKTNISDPIDSAKIHRIELNDGSVFIGNILQKDSENIVIRTSTIPKMEIPIKKIKSIENIDESNFQNGIYWFPNPHASRYLYGPSAFSLKKGEGYYQNTYLLLNSFNVGITDNFSIGGGLELISTFATRKPIFFITPKVGFKVSEKFHAGGGFLFASMPSFYSAARFSLGTAFVTGTYGSKEHNMTGSLGWGFVEGKFSGSPIITLSGMTRVSERASLITENWLAPIGGGYYGLFSYGVRFFGKKMAVDLAFINNPDIAKAILIGIPYVSFTVKF